MRTNHWTDQVIEFVEPGVAFITIGIILGLLNLAFGFIHDPLYIAGPLIVGSGSLAVLGICTFIGAKARATADRASKSPPAAPPPGGTAPPAPAPARADAPAVDSAAVKALKNRAVRAEILTALGVLIGALQFIKG